MLLNRRKNLEAREVESERDYKEQPEPNQEEEVSYEEAIQIEDDKYDEPAQSDRKE